MNISTHPFGRFFLLAAFVCMASVALGQRPNNVDTVRFSTSTLAYNPKTLSVELGDTVRFIGSFGTHPLMYDEIPAQADTFARSSPVASSAFDYVPKVLGKYTYYCTNHGSPGGFNMAGSFTVVPMGVHEEEPIGVELSQNVPNPVASQTTISLSLKKESKIELTLHRIDGSLVSVLASGTFGDGRHDAHFDASQLATGTYFYTLRANGGAVTKQMVVTK